MGGWEEGLIVKVSRTFPPLLLSSLSLSYSLFLSECVCVSQGSFNGLRNSPRSCNNTASIFGECSSESAHSGPSAPGLSAGEELHATAAEEAGSSQTLAGAGDLEQDNTTQATPVEQEAPQGRE